MGKVLTSYSETGTRVYVDEIKRHWQDVSVHVP